MARGEEGARDEPGHENGTGGERQGPRPRYNSDGRWNDERRRIRQEGAPPGHRQHVRIHTSVTNHPKMVEVWPDNDLFATWNRVMVMASEKGAVHTGDVLFFTDTQLREMTGSTRFYRKLFARLCDKLHWLYAFPGALDEDSITTRATLAARSRFLPEPLPPNSSDTRGMVWLRNLAEKQGLDGVVRRRSGGKLRHTSPSPSVVPDPGVKKEEDTPPIVPPEAGGDATRLLAKEHEDHPGSANGNGTGKKRRSRRKRAEPEDLPPKPSGENFDYPEDFKRAWAKYPARGETTNPIATAYEKWRMSLAEGVTPLALEKATERYARYCRDTNIYGTDKVMQGQRFYHPKNRFWEDPFIVRRRQAPGALSDYQPIRGGGA